MRRLRFSGAEIDAVRQLVLLHMRPIQYQSDWADSAIRRLWHAAGELRPELLALARADTEGSSYPGLELLAELEDRLAAVGDAHPQGLRPPLGGEHLKAAFGLPPGPWIGRAQAALLEAVMEGQLPPADEPSAQSAAITYLEDRRDSWQPRSGEPGAEFGG
jgi:poly(A) polymerase